MAQSNRILVTGGAGYLGSHTCVALIQAGYQVVVLDNLSNSHPQAMQRIERITGQTVPWIQADIRDCAALQACFEQYAFAAVIHFAGLKAVGESVQDPMRYYDNNVVGSLRLLQAMQQAGVHTLIFSSSATVYGDPVYLPFDEKHPLAPTNPYGQSKLMIERMLQDVWAANGAFRLALLRYFNPVGAHPSGLIGEDPLGVPNNLMPFIAQVAIGQRPALNIWGDDYPTLDGTGVRDYIHVCDLAEGHVKALQVLLQQQRWILANLGTGHGYSVMQVLRAFEQAAQRTIPYHMQARRPGDVAAAYADIHNAQQQLQWQAQRDLQQMCEDHWRWQVNNPQGYLTPDKA